MLVRSDPSWFYSFIPQELAGGPRSVRLGPVPARDALRQQGQGPADGAFATFLFTHNAQIAIFAFALGFAFAVPTALLMVYNGLMLGAFLAIFAAKGLGSMLGGWLIIHGMTELFAICIWRARRASDRPGGGLSRARASRIDCAGRGRPDRRRRRWPASW